MKKIFHGFFRHLHSGANPVLIKEIRQAVRSRFVIGAMMLLLFILVLVAGGTILSSGITRDSTAGRGLFLTVYVILTGAILWFVPVFIGLRVGLERAGKDPDLLFITTLTPGKVIRGKLQVAAVLSLLFVSLSLPFMVFSTLLQGVDQITIFLIVILSYFGSLLLSSIAILVGCIPTSRLMRGLILLGGMGALLLCIVAAVGLAEEWSRGYLFDSTLEAFQATGGFIVGMLAILAFAYALATALISPPAANRMRPVRITASILLFGTCPLVLGWLLPDGEISLILWSFLCVAMLLFMTLTAISERDFLSPRVLAGVPKNLLGRLAFFPWFSGCASGLAWVGVHLLLGFGIFLISLEIHTSGSSLDGEDIRIIFTWILTFFFWALLAMFIQRNVLKRIPRYATWGLCIFLISLGTLIPFFLQILFTMDFEPDKMLIPYGNIIALAADPDRMDYFFFGLISCMLLGLLLLPNFLMQLDRFRPPEAEAALADEVATKSETDETDGAAA